jgi:hypothetical protein
MDFSSPKEIAETLSILSGIAASICGLLWLYFKPKVNKMIDDKAKETKEFVIETKKSLKEDIDNVSQENEKDYKRFSEEIHSLKVITITGFKALTQRIDNWIDGAAR